MEKITQRSKNLNEHADTVMEPLSGKKRKTSD